MGHIGSAIASRLGYNKKWKSSWVMSGKNYKSYFQKDLLMLRVVKNSLNNYGNPDFSFDLRRNNKEEDSNKKSGEEGILKNPFVTESLTHSHTRIARGLGLNVNTYVMDSHLDGWRIKYTRNFRKVPSILFKPVIRNWRKPRLLVVLKKKRNNVNNLSRRKSRKLLKNKNLFIPRKTIRKKFRRSENLDDLLKNNKKKRYKIGAKKKKITGAKKKKVTGAFFNKLVKRFLKVTQNKNPEKNAINTKFKKKYKVKRYKYKYNIITNREIYNSAITEPVVENTVNSRRLIQTYLNYTVKKLHLTQKIQLFSVLTFAVVYSAITSLPKRLINFITGCFKHGVLLYNKVKKQCLVFTMLMVFSVILFYFSTFEAKFSISKPKVEIIFENTNKIEPLGTKKPEVNPTFKALVEDNNHVPEHAKNKRFFKFYAPYKRQWNDFCSNRGGLFKNLSKKLSPKIAFTKIRNYFNNNVYNSKKQALKKKMKRYPLFFFQWLLKYRYSFLLPPSPNRFPVFKALILGFRWIIRHSKKVQFFFLTTFRSLLLSLFLLPGFIPRFFMIKMLSLLLLKEFSFRHLNSYFFNKIFNTRFIVFQTTYAALSNTIQSFDSFKRFSYNFFGMHTRNVTPSLVVNYICHKLGQYFQINQIIGPVMRHLKRLRSLRGFCLKIFGRLTRKERAAVIIRKFRRVTLAKKSADIEHASQSKALRFGMSGVSAWFMLQDQGAKPMAYNFSMSLFPYVNVKKLTNYIKSNEISNCLFSTVLFGTEEQNMAFAGGVFCLMTGFVVLRYLGNYLVKRNNVVQKAICAAYNNTNSPQTLSTNNNATTQITSNNNNNALITTQITSNNNNNALITTPITSNNNAIITTPIISDVLDATIVPDPAPATLNSLEKKSAISNMLHDLEKKFWFMSVFPRKYVMNFITAGFFDNIYNLLYRSDLPKKAMLKIFSFNLGATSLSLIRENHDVAAVFLVYYLLFPHVKNRLQIAYIAKNIPLLNAAGKLKFLDYLHPNIVNVLDQETKAILENLVAQQIVRVEEAIAFAKISILSKEQFFYFNSNKTEQQQLLERYGNRVIYENRTNQLHPDGAFIIQQDDNLAVAFDVKNINDNPDTYNSNYIRVKSSNSAVQHFLCESSIDLSNKLDHLVASGQDIRAYTNKILRYKKSLKELHEIYVQNLDLTEYLKNFILLYFENISWTTKFKITLNIPILIDINDLNPELITPIVEPFIKKFSKNLSENSDFFIVASEYLEPQGNEIKKKTHDLLIEICQRLFPDLFS